MRISTVNFGTQGHPVNKKQNKNRPTSTSTEQRHNPYSVPPKKSSGIISKEQRFHSQNNLGEKRSDTGGKKEHFTPLKIDILGYCGDIPESPNRYIFEDPLTGLPVICRFPKDKYDKMCELGIMVSTRPINDWATGDPYSDEQIKELVKNNPRYTDCRVEKKDSSTKDYYIFDEKYTMIEEFIKKARKLRENGNSISYEDTQELSEDFFNIIDICYGNDEEGVESLFQAALFSKDEPNDPPNEFDLLKSEVQTDLISNDEYLDLSPSEMLLIITYMKLQTFDFIKRTRDNINK